MEDIVHIAELFRKLESVGYRADPRKDLERSYVPWIKFTPFSKHYNSFPWREFQHYFVCNLEFKGFSPNASIVFLAITSGIQSLLDLHDLLHSIMYVLD